MLAMREGARVARPGWNGKGMWLALQPSPYADGKTPPALPEGEVWMTEEYIYMKTAQGGRIPWLCSQADLLAEDWEIVRG